MTVSTHTYAAYLVGTPDQELDIKGGRISLDATRIPHVEAELRIVLDDVAEQLDPRQAQRIRVEVDATFSSGATQHRDFTLAVRNRSAVQLDGTVSVLAASDETYLEDYKPLADDWSPLTLAASLRDVVDYVLTESNAGSLEASPTNDADITPYWALSNLLPNPNANTALGNWEAGGANGRIVRATGGSGLPVTGGTYLRTTWTGNSGDGLGGASARSATIEPYCNVQQGREYTVSCWARIASGTKPVRLKVEVRGPSGEYAATNRDVTTATLTTTWQRISGTVRTPVGTARLSPYLYADTGSQFTSGEILYTCGWMVTDGPLLVDYFDGSHTPSGYTVEWEGDPDLSASTRTPSGQERSPEALHWTAGTAGIDFLHPLLQAAGLRLVCNEHQEWTLRPSSYLDTGAVNIRYGVNLIDGTEAIDRGEGEWFDAAVTRYTWVDPNGIEHERLDAYTLVDPPTRVQLFEKNTPYPGDGFSQYAVERAQQRGRYVSATAVANWNATAEQTCSFVLSGAPTQTGKTERVEFDLDLDEMTLTSRTTDTDPAAWVLLAADEEWLDSPIGESWTEEVI